MLGAMHLPAEPVVDYRVDREQLVNEAVWFSLRGIGLTEKAIATYYNPNALSLFFGFSAQSTQQSA
jgi:hypothetical protein